MSAPQRAALRAEVTEVILRAKLPRGNIPKEELKALRELKEDEDVIVVPADKGKCLVVMDKTEYVTKMEEKLQDTTTYVEIRKDPTTEIQNELKKHLQVMQEAGEVSEWEYWRLYPNETQIPRMYGLPKIHKEGYPLREIVDGNGGLTKKVHGYISSVLKTYIGESEYYVKNSEHFVKSLEGVKVEEGEVLVSYDVKALYPSIPHDEAIRVIRRELTNDAHLSKKTSMSVDNFVKLFEICVQRTYFSFNQRLYQQVDGLAIGASTSGFAAEIYMYQLEKKALDSFVRPPTVWKRYVDDTFAKLETRDVDDFLTHLNNQHPRIQFTTEIQTNSRIAFLDTEVIVGHQGTLETRIYRKPTHTNQYLNFDSNHHVRQKLGIVSTLRHRADTLVSDHGERKKEKELIENCMRANGYPEWTLRPPAPAKRKETPINTTYKTVSIPYVKGVSEKIAAVYKRYNIRTAHRPSNTLKQSLCNKLKDPVHQLDKVDAIYEVRCEKHDVSYVGETYRALKNRAYDHALLDHRTSNISHSIPQSYSSRRPPALARVRTNVGGSDRRSSRLARKEPLNYAKMDTGADQPLSEGNTAVSRHMRTLTHAEADVTIRPIAYEPWKRRREIKESLEIYWSRWKNIVYNILIFKQ